MFKRNQVEEAITRVLEPGSGRPSLKLRTRLKRLLETDRALGRNKRAADPQSAHFAFYSKDPPGRGAENWFSDYEVFALLTGLRLMRHGWPQGYAVAVLRRVKPELENHHARILKQSQAVLFDDRLIHQQAKAGSLGLANTDPVFLVINSRDERDPSESHPAAVCRGERQLMQFIKSHEIGQTWTIFEFVNIVYALSSALATTKPRKRGRAN